MLTRSPTALAAIVDRRSSAQHYRPSPRRQARASATPWPALHRPSALRRFVASKSEANTTAVGAGLEDLDARIIHAAG